MGAVLAGCKDEIGQGKEAWIEVHTTSSVLEGKALLKGVRQVLEVCQSSRVDKVPEQQKVAYCLPPISES